MSKVKSLLSQCGGLLRKMKWQFLTNDSKQYLIMNVSKDGQQHLLKLQVDEESSIITVTLSYKKKTPYDYRKQVLDYINKLNFELSIGGFEMDRRDGEVRFRHSVDAESIKLTDIFVNNIVKSVALTGCKYHSNFLEIMAGRDLEEES